VHLASKRTRGKAEAQQGGQPMIEMDQSIPSQILIAAIAQDPMPSYDTRHAT